MEWEERRGEKQTFGEGEQDRDGCKCTARALEGMIVYLDVEDGGLVSANMAQDTQDRTSVF